MINNSSCLIILSAPSIKSNYYKKHFNDIINFQKEFISKVNLLTNDKIMIFSDDDTYVKISSEFQAENIRKFDFSDIWIRDFSSTICDFHFKYSRSYENDQKAAKKWLKFAECTNLDYKNFDFELDGGNAVHNGKDKLIVTRRFLEDNKIENEEKGVKILQNIYKSFKYFAIIPYDDEVLGHADGIVSFIDEDTLLVMKCENQKLFNEIKEIITKVFQGIKIIEIEAHYSNEKYRGIYSASGCYANILTTIDNIYVPLFGLKYDNEVLEIIKKNTKKNVIGVDCSKVCILGGNIRCLSWEIYGENIEKILKASDKMT